MDHTVLLAELQMLDPGERVSRLAQSGDPASLLIKLLDHVESLVISDLSAARDAADLLIEIGDELSLPTVRSRARRCLAQVHAYSNRFDDALTELENAIMIAVSAGDDVEAARSRLTSLHGLARLGRYDEAIAQGESAKRVLLEHGRTDLAARADINLGVTHRMNDDPAAALQHFDEAREQLTDQHLLAQLESNRAEALLDLSKFHEAEEAFNRARDNFERLGHVRAMAIVEGNLADLLSRQGRYTEALEHFARAEQFFADQEAPGDLARLQAEHAELLANIGMWDEAAEYYRAALPVLDEHRLAFEAARTRAGYGRVLAAIEQLGDADAAFSKAAEGFEQLGHHTGLARVTMLRADLASRHRRNDDARRLLVEALDLLQDRPADRVVVQGRLAALALATNNTEAADALLDEAMHDARKLNLAPRLAELLGIRAKVSEMRGNPRAARDDLRASVGQVERLRGTLQSIRLRHAFHAGRIDFYEHLVLALLEDDPEPLPAEAFAVCERARARSLLDQLAAPAELARVVRTAAQAALTQSSEIQVIVQLRSRLNALYSRLDELNPVERDAAIGAEWREEVEQCERQLALAEHRLEMQQGTGSLFAAPVTLERLQVILPDGVSLIEYFLAGDELLTFVVTAERVDFIRSLGTRDDVYEAVERLDFQIMRTVHHLAGGADAAQRTRTDFDHELACLGEMLIAPLHEYIDAAQRLIIVPHGPLHHVPFHALRIGDRYVVEKYSTSTLPSASVLEHLHSLHQSDKDDVAVDDLVVSVPDESAPRIAEEAQAVTRVLSRSIALSGEQATIDALREAAFRCRLIHFACHGRFSAAHPMASGLKLADGWLTLREISGLDLHGAIVTLSGCDTGRNVIGSADEFVGIMRGLFAAGAACIVVSQWMTHDKFTEKLVASVYTSWQNSKEGREAGMIAALSDVQRQWLRQEVHPIHWASFSVLGAS